MLVGRGLSHSYSKKDTILENLEFQWSPGDQVGIYGANGVGKSTLLRILSTHLLPSQGNLTYSGEDCFSKLRSYRSKLSYLQSEGSAFFGRLTGRENLEVFFYHRQPGVDLSKKLIVWEQLPSFKKALSTQLYLCSSGMKQILALFRCLEVGAQIYMLDEPAKYLDSDSVAFISKKLDERSADSLQIIASHQLPFIDQQTSTKYIIENAQLLPHH